MKSTKSITINQLELYSLFIFSCLYLFIFLGASPLIDWDENIYAEASKQMVLRGNYLNVYINDTPFAEKPPFFFWEQALSYHIFGIHEFSARFPAALAGLAMILLLYFFGKAIYSSLFGWLWAFIYLTSLLPSILARSSVIDSSFNFWITMGVFFLYLYDQKYVESLEKKQTQKYWLFLLIASISMGIAVLTKGPIGGFIPVFCFLIYKLCFQFSKVCWFHFLICGVFSLSISSSWYVWNWFEHGDQFIQQFSTFQQNLWSKPLEGHTGPFYYHIIVAMFGVFPWTAFLFIKRNWFGSNMNQNIKLISIISIAWILIVLLIFSLVKTKLPHYSASFYIPFSFLITVALFPYIEQQKRFPLWNILFYFFFGICIAGLLISFPYLIEYAVIKKQLDLQIIWDWKVWIAGSSVLLAIVISTFYFYQVSYKKGLISIGIGFLIFTWSLWKYNVPVFLQMTQIPLIREVQKIHETGKKLAFYRFISFAAFYYGEKPIEMLYTSKFPSHPEVLSNPKEEIYIISDKEYHTQFLKEYPQAQHIKFVSTYSIFKIP